MIKKIAYLIAGLLLFPAALLAQSMTEADDSFEQNHFDQAKSKYQTLLGSAADADRLKAQLRIVACDYYQGEFLGAAKAAYGYELPSDPLWKARFLFYRIDVATQVKNSYRRILADSETVSSSAETDLSRLTAQQWNEKINQDYKELWSLRDILINAPIEKESLILDLKNADTKRYPTLFDVLVYNWQNRLTAERVTPLLRADNFVTAEYKTPEKINNNMEKLASILDTASKLDGKNRQDAKIFWQVDRILLPFNWSNSFTSDAQNKPLDSAIKLLETISGFDAKKPGFFDRLKGYVLPAKTDYAKAYAALCAAEELNRIERYEEAINICTYSVKELGKNNFTNSCKDLISSIKTPALSLTSPAMNQNPADISLEVTTRNISKIYVRVYTTTPQRLKEFYTAQYGSSPRYTPTINSWNYLTDLREETIKNLVKQAPFKTLEGSVTYEKPYAFNKQLPLKLPELEKGFYIVLVSDNPDFNQKQGNIVGVTLNMTDLALFLSAAIEGNPEDYRLTPSSKSRTLNPDVFRVYAMNLSTGQPIPGTNLTLFTEWKGTQQKGTTDANGLFSLARAITVGPDKNNSYFINPMAEKDGNYAFTNNALYFHFYPNATVQLFADTDRAIYRPGQKIHYSANAFEAAARGLKTLPSGNVTFTVRDPNYEPIHTQTLSLNEMGTAAGEFVLPQGILLGGYNISAEIKRHGQAFRTNTYFNVDDYKRPDYEVTLEDPKTAFEYGKTAQVQGIASYYFGAPLQKAAVKYTVSRVEFRPRFYWWMPPLPNIEAEYITNGETKTDDKGNFKIEFTPSAPENNTPAVYTVLAEVYDESGRIINASKTYKASQKPNFFSVEFTQGFYDENAPASLAKLNLTDINGAPASGKVIAEITQLENFLPEQVPAKSTPYRAYSPENDQNAANRLEALFGKNKEIKRISSREFDFKKQGEQFVSIPALPEGIYKLTLKNNKADEQTLVFLVAAKESRLALPQIALPQHPTYYPGADAKILIGSGALNAPKYVEVYQGGSFLTKKDTAPSQVSIYTLPIAPSYRGGVYLRWFGASNYQTYNAQAGITVPNDNKQLDVQLKSEDTVKPGQKVSWTLTAKDTTGNGIQAQANITVYDKALDYYAKKNTVLSLLSLFPDNTLSAEFANSFFSISASDFHKIAQESKPEEFQRLGPPSSNLELRTREAFSLTRTMVKGARAAALRAYSNDSMTIEEMAVDSAAMPMAASKQKADAETGATETEIPEGLRTDFSETAYYNPMLPLNGGKADIRFTMPDSLTSWNILGFVLTRAADFGAFSATSVTRKDLMVRLASPRFYREGDRSQIQALVTNLGKKKITAEIELFLKKDGQNAAVEFGISKTKKTVSISAGATAKVAWDITVAQGVGELSVALTARSGKESDGEQKTLAILPSRERLMATVNTALKNGSNTLNLTELQNAKNAQPETAVLQISPSLVLNVLNAMPSLIQSPYKDLVTQLNKYVPLAVVNKFYTAYPQLRQAVSNLPKRSTVSPVWDEENLLRMTLLEETPWLQTAQGNGPGNERLVDLFNPAVVGKAKAKALASILKYQNESGAFSWLPGGTDDNYLTLYALSSFAEAERFGAEIPEENIRKALAYMTGKMDKQLTQNSENFVPSVAYALYASYVFTSYPAQWKEVQNAKPFIEKWMVYAEKQAKFMTPLGHTYAAAVFNRLGQHEKAQNYMTLVLSRMKTNSLTGSYFAPEAQSWVWYNDTLQTQTTTLQTLLELRPEAPEIAQMVQWLLFNRQAQQWESSRATAGAIYALLEVMQKDGFMNQDSSYQITWADSSETKTFKSFDWSGDLQLSKEGAQITPAAYSAQITKKGGTVDFASLSVIYTDKNAKASPKGVMNVKREYFLKFMEDGISKIRPLADLSEVKIGEQVEVQLTVNTDSAFDYVLLKDPKPAGFESQDLLSGWTWNPVAMYQENRDAATNFYINTLPAGEMMVKYILRPTTAGEYRSLPAQLQSMYAPQFGAHTAADVLTVN